MKKINWNIMIFTCLLCLMPICLGIYFYEELPESMAIHFNINNEPDNWASKNFTLFALPIIMAGLQIFCCIVSDIAESKTGNSPKISKIMKWFVPIVTILIYTLTILIGLGKTVDIGKIICIFLGLMFIVMGNYMPKIPYEDAKLNMKPVPKSEKEYRKMLRIMAYSFIVGGIAIIGAIFASGKAAFITILGLCFIVFVESIYFAFK